MVSSLMDDCVGGASGEGKTKTGGKLFCFPPVWYIKILFILLHSPGVSSS